MELTSDESSFILWYRTLTTQEQNAVRQYVHQNDETPLAVLGKRSECLNRLSHLTVAQRNDESTFVSIEIGER